MLFLKGSPQDSMASELSVIKPLEPFPPYKKRGYSLQMGTTSIVNNPPRSPPPPGLGAVGCLVAGWNHGPARLSGLWMAYTAMDDPMSSNMNAIIAGYVLARLGHREASHNPLSPFWHYTTNMLESW